MGVGGQRHDPAAFTPRKDPVHIVQETGWAPVCICAENLTPTGVRSPDLPACGASLWRLRSSGRSREYKNRLHSKKVRTSANSIRQVACSPATHCLDHTPNKVVREVALSLRRRNVSGCTWLNRIMWIRTINTEGRGRKTPCPIWRQWAKGFL
jgi:hypothetical protein